MFVGVICKDPVKCFQKFSVSLFYRPGVAGAVLQSSECDGRVLEQLGVHRILQFPAVSLDFNRPNRCVSSMHLNRRH